VKSSAVESRRLEIKVMPEVRGPLSAWLAPITWPLARCYGTGVAWRNARFDRGVGVERLEVRVSEGGSGVVAPPVVSIGNLTAGGTGKSPFVAWCAAELAAIGAKPVIALRGYRAARVGTSSEVISDEAAEYASTAPMAKVVVGARRREALMAELGAMTAENWRNRAAVLLDDGFQHRQLARELDVVLVDATRPGLDGDLLPNGWLREPARNIARADLVVLTKADDEVQRARAAALVAKFRGRPHDAVCVHAWSGIEVIHAQECARISAADLSGLRVIAACALGNPSHFHGMLQRAGAHIVDKLTKADHRPFTIAELEQSASRAGVREVVLSRKDFVKLDAKLSREIDLLIPELSIAFLEGEERVRAAIAQVISARNSRANV
jgi:tetraacyldisaccharide 4'-kinase